MNQKSVLAQIGETVFGGGLMFVLLQVFTAGILVLAANTAFNGLPHLKWSHVRFCIIHSPPHIGINRIIHAF